jgi:hypothetical protein
MPLRAQGRRKRNDQPGWIDAPGRKRPEASDVRARTSHHVPDHIRLP